MNSPRKSPRCAVYTRKSNAAGLEKEFNSLHSQREACSNFIASQGGEGFVELETAYDDGGHSGGSMDRPAMKLLMSDILCGKVDVVVVYKIDRLSRSLRDFVRILEVFEKHGVTFIAVTQAFNTTTSMGRLVFNVLLSFAQFEREMTSDRLRDKFAALRAKGLWTGPRPLGYRVQKLRLVVDPDEANLVRLMYARYIALGSGRAVANALTSEGYVTQAGGRINSAFVLRHVESRLYRGELRHRGDPVPGIHEPVVSEETWQQAQEALETRKRAKPGHAKARGDAMLKGRIFGPEGRPMLLTFTYGAGDKVYRYYASAFGGDGSAVRRPVVRFRAADLEEAVARLVCNLVEAGGIPGVRRIKPGPPSERPSSRPSRDLADHRSMVRQVVDRVDVRDGNIAITLKSAEAYDIPLPLVGCDLPRLTPAHGSRDPG